MHKLCNVQKTCLPEAVYLVDFEDRELRVSESYICLSKASVETHRLASTPRNSSSIFMVDAFASTQPRKCAVETAANSVSKVT
jgi:hypothetical protein